MNVSASFDLCCTVDLKQLSFKARNAEYNPRRGSSVTLRLLDPKATGRIRESGKVVISGRRGITSDELKRAAKKITRIVQKSGHEEAKCSLFRFTISDFKTDLPLPVRLEALARKWWQHAFYEPEVTSS